MQVNKQTIKLFTVILFDLIVIIFLIIYFGFIHFHSNIKIHGTYLNSPLSISDFHLQDHHGQPFDKTKLAGHWSMLFFGFTDCSMICPKTLSVLNDMYKRLQKALPTNQLPTIIFISVNPNEDSIEKIYQFVNSFNPHFIGVRGSSADIVALEKKLHIPVSENLINHSTDIVLLSPSAHIQAYFSYPHQAEQMAIDYKNILKAHENDSVIARQLIPTSN